jgi:hypothetical protein
MTDYKELLGEMPVGLDRAVLRVLSYRRGRDRAVGRTELVNLTAAEGFRVHERALREQIKQLRRAGHLICSMPGEDGGYYLAKDLVEYQEFKRMEFEGKIADMAETLRAMDAAAVKEFGSAAQMGLF